MKGLRSGALALGLLLFLASQAWAYGWLVNRGCHGGRIIRSRVHVLALNNVSFPDQSIWEGTFRKSIDEVNDNVPGSGWRQGWTKSYKNYIRGNDGFSEAAFIQFTPAGIDPRFNGYTSWWYDWGWNWGGFCVYWKAIGEADVVLNADNPVWNPLLTAIPFDRIPSEKSVAQHEIMHTAGLQHESRVVATMGAGPFGAYFGPDRNLPLIHSDDKAGLRFLYFNGASGIDVAVHGFAQVDTTPEYGRFDVVTQGTVVNRGSAARFDYTMENHGTGTVDTDMGVYLSLAGGPWQKVLIVTITGLPAGYAGTHTFFIPTSASTTPGSYRVRVVMNDSGRLSETTTANNELIYPTPLRVQ